MAQPLVLVTGASGYLGTHVVRTLQAAGHRVRGTVRSTKDLKKIQHLYELCPTATHKLELVEADLNNSDSWKAAVRGCTYVHHVASPFPLERPKDEMEVIGPAVEGTLGVLRACAEVGGVKRVILTSSSAAIAHKGGNTVPHTEKDWSDLSDAEPYPKSKHLAEKAAWDFVKDLQADKAFELAVVNPVFIIGPTLHGGGGSSLELLKRIMTAMPVIPAMNMATIDVRDCAEAHLKCMTLPEAAGNRHILSNQSAWFIEVAQILAKEFNPQGFKVSTWQLPLWSIWVMSFFSSYMASVYKRGSSPRIMDNSRMRNVLGIEPTPMEKSVIDMAYSMIEKGFIEKPPQYRGPKK